MRADAMAVGTSHDALGDLCSDSIEAVAATRQDRDGEHLGRAVAVVELQDTDVAVAAVDARVLRHREPRCGKLPAGSSC
jgi:hypothetical protein